MPEPWEEIPDKRELIKILSLEDGESFETCSGVVWMRFVGDDLRESGGVLEDEFKVSPHGEMNPDTESEWIDREDLLRRLQELIE